MERRNWMEWAQANLMTLAGILLAFAAFASTLAGALPADVGAQVTTVAIVATAAGRGIVLAVEELRAPERVKSTAEAIRRPEQP